jgi:CheY-like chemotaxis protein
MRANKFIPLLSAVLILLALAKLALPDNVVGRMDTIFFVLICAAFVVPLVPFERLKSLKAAGIELSIELPQVQGVISGMRFERIEDERLREKLSETLSRMKDEVEVIRGSRVLWIDDHPDKVLSLRRLLRSLGVEVVAAVSSAAAEEILGTDKDFDLIISDVQREGDSHKVVGGIPIHEGVNFVVKLRTKSALPFVKSLPVVFYAAYDWPRLVQFTRPAREHQPEAEISNSPADFLVKVVKQLAIAHYLPLPPLEAEKTPTPASIN